MCKCQTCMDKLLKIYLLVSYRTVKFIHANFVAHSVIHKFCTVYLGHCSKDCG